MQCKILSSLCSILSFKENVDYIQISYEEFLENYYIGRNGLYIFNICLKDCLWFLQISKAFDGFPTFIEHCL